MGFLTKCPLCNGDFNDAQPFTGTSGVVFIPPHPLYEYCDAGLHLECLEIWDKRIEFSEGYFKAHKETFLEIGVLIHESEDWIIGCGPASIDETPYYAEVNMREWPCRLYTRWDMWNDFIKSGYKKGLDGEALEAATHTIEQVKKIAPDKRALEKLRLNIFKNGYS